MVPQLRQKKAVELSSAAFFCLLRHRTEDFLLVRTFTGRGQKGNTIPLLSVPNKSIVFKGVNPLENPLFKRQKEERG